MGAPPLNPPGWFDVETGASEIWTKAGVKV